MLKLYLKSVGLKKVLLGISSQTAIFSAFARHLLHAGELLVRGELLDEVLFSVLEIDAEVVYVEKLVQRRVSIFGLSTIHKFLDSLFVGRMKLHGTERHSKTKRARSILKVFIFNPHVDVLYRHL